MINLYCIDYITKSAEGEKQNKRFFLFAEGILKAEIRFLKVTDLKKKNIIDIRRVEEWGY